MEILAWAGLICSTILWGAFCGMTIRNPILAVLMGGGGGYLIAITVLPWWPY